jgi:N-acetylneuraminic acid mutarotase
MWRTRTVLVVFVLAAVSQLGFLGVRPANAAAGWLDPWQYRQTVVVTNGATALSNYQVKVPLSTSFDFASAQASGNDLRFTSSDGTTLLNYWVESYNAAARTATLWAKVPTLAANTATTLYLYYGNASAPAASNGASTFPFFDDFNNPSWQTLPNMPFSAADETVAQANGKLYIIGGYNNTASNPLNSNYQFDPATNAYAQKANMPTARWGVIAATVSNKIYAFGGQIATGAGTGANEMYDPATNVWATKASLPAGLSAQGVTGCTDGTKIYLFYNNLAYSYNPATNSYAQLASILPGQPMLSWGSCSYVNGKIYVIGGYSNGAVSYNRIYTIATNTWTCGADLPFRMYGSLRENPVVGSNIYVVQGQQADSEFSSAVYQYNTVTNSWVQKSFGPHAADGVAGASYNGKIYTFGGRQDGTGPYGLSFAAVYNPALDTNQNWTQLDGNFEVSGGNLHRMVPSRGSITSGPLFSQVQTTSYRTAGNFILEAQGNQPAAGWNTIGINSNAGEYNYNFTGYLVPQNDWGVTPNATSIYRENGTTYNRLVTGAVGTGTQRFKVVSTAASVALYRGGTLAMSTTDTTYRGGSLSMITSSLSPASWDFMFTRGYAAAEPTVSLGTVSTPGQIPATYSMWPAAATPAGAETEDVAYELGGRFYSEVPGKITGLRFYKESGTGVPTTHTVKLWDASGNLLASAATTGESASGWQSVLLPTAAQVTIAANTPYIVSYIINASQPYAINVEQLASQEIHTAGNPLHLYKDGVVGPNGVFHVGGVGFPTQSWGSSNYWADVVFAQS